MDQLSEDEGSRGFSPGRAHGPDEIDSRARLGAASILPIPTQVLVAEGEGADEIPRHVPDFQGTETLQRGEQFLAAGVEERHGSA